MIASLELSEESRPAVLSLPDEDHVRVRLRLIGRQGDVRPAQCHRNSALSEPGREVIRVRRTGRVEGDRYQVGRRLKIDWLHRFIDMEHGPMEQKQGRRLEESDAVCHHGSRHQSHIADLTKAR